MASAGIGSAPHMFGEMFQRMAGVQLAARAVSRQSDPRRHQRPRRFLHRPDAVGAESSAPASCARSASRRRRDLPALPDVAPVADVVKGYEASGWLGIGAPKGTPADAIARLANKAVNDTTGGSLPSRRTSTASATPWRREPAPTFGQLDEERRREMGQVIQSANIKLEQ